MFHRFRLAISFVGILAGVSAGERTVLNEQSPRQALIEMLSSGEASFKKHLTVEMQGKLQNLMKASLDNAQSPLQVLLGVNSSTTRFQAFDIGPILFAFSNPQEHQRYEIKIDGEDRRGDQDTMELSLHMVRNAQEKEVPGSLRFVVNMKRQESVWRLNSLTMNATLPMGSVAFMVSEFSRQTLSCRFMFTTKRRLPGTSFSWALRTMCRESSMVSWSPRRSSPSILIS